jgi:ABC-2 type transport system permease protein
MRWDFVKAIIRKDFLEFKKNKYILYTLATFPIVFAIIMPLTILTPILLVGGIDFGHVETTGPPKLALTYDLNQTEYNLLRTGMNQNETLMLKGYHIRNIDASYIILNGSWIENSSLDYVIIRNCRLNNVTIAHGQIYNTYLVDSSIGQGDLIDSWGNNVTVTIDVTSFNIKITDLKDPNAIDINDLITTLIATVLMMFVLIPSATPTIISSYSIIGEKKNKSLEPILATPISDLELLTGKILASFLPTIGTTFGAFVVFSIIMGFISMPILGFNIAFEPILLLGVFLLAPLVCMLSIEANVFISSKINDIRAAQQLGSLVVLPLIFLFMIPIMGLATLGPIVLVLMAFILGLVDAALMYLTVKVFNRENILVNWS